MSNGPDRPLSYTQNLEDYHLSLAFAGQPQGFYIDIGAGHPVADNVSFWFYERGWRGMAVEPQTALAALYPKLRPRDAIVTELVGRASGEAEFFRFERLHGLSTTVKQHAAASGDGYATVRHKVTTLAELCARHDVPAIDFLKIDVEGAEADVLAGGDWQRFRPRIVVVEAVTPLTGEPSWQEWEPFLLAQGYRFRLFDSLNRFYVAQECPDLFERLPAERGDWGAVRHMYEIGRAPENPAHPEHGLAGEIARGLWAGLPHLEAEVIAMLLARGRGLDPDEARLAILAEIDSDAFRARIGRIACGYDGGQIVED